VIDRLAWQTSKALSCATRGATDFISAAPTRRGRTGAAHSSFYAIAGAGLDGYSSAGRDKAPADRILFDRIPSYRPSVNSLVPCRKLRHYRRGIAWELQMNKNRAQDWPFRACRDRLDCGRELDAAIPTLDRAIRSAPTPTANSQAGWLGGSETYDLLLSGCWYLFKDGYSCQATPDKQQYVCCPTGQCADMQSESLRALHRSKRLSQL